MDAKIVTIGIIAVMFLAILGAVYFYTKSQESFVGDFSIDSGFRAVDQAMGGSGELEDPINQS